MRITRTGWLRAPTTVHDGGETSLWGFTNRLEPGQSQISQLLLSSTSQPDPAVSHPTTITSEAEEAGHPYIQTYHTILHITWNSLICIGTTGRDGRI